MTEVLFSLRPEHAANILNGVKGVELRKTIPHRALPFSGYIYVSQRRPILFFDRTTGQYRVESVDEVPARWQPLNGKVVCEFVCNRFDVFKGGVIDDIQRSIFESAMVEKSFFDAYAGGKDVYGISVSHVNRFAIPLTLDCFEGTNGKTVGRAPQSWQYVRLKNEYQF